MSNRILTVCQHTEEKSEFDFTISFGMPDDEKVVFIPLTEDQWSTLCRAVSLVNHDGYEMVKRVL